MSFSYSAGVITQTGTDTNLSGLNGISGVTINVSGQSTATYKIYTLDSSTRLIIDGTLTIDPEIEQLVIAKKPPTSTTDITYPCTVNGSLILGKQKTGNNNTSYSSGVTLNFTGLGDVWWRDKSLSISSGGSFTMYGSTIRTGGSLLFNDGCSLLVEKGEIYNVHNADIAIRFRESSGILRKLTFDGRQGSNIRINISNGIAEANLILKNAFYYTEVLPQSDILFTNYDVSLNINTTSIRFEDSAQDNLVEINNASNRLNFVQSSSNGNRDGYCRVFRVFNVPITDLNNNSITYSYYGKDINNGNRVASSKSTFDDTADKIYSGINQTQNFQERILWEVFIGINSVAYVDDRTDQNDTIPIIFISYNESLKTYDPALIGLNTVTDPLKLEPDFLITEANRNIVDAYTELETPEKLYDRAKSYLVSNFVGQSLYVTRSGNLINAGAYNVTIDATASTAFDLTGNTITIKASVFTGNINTTGSFTLLNGAVFNGVLNGVLNVNNNDVLTKDIDGVFVVNTDTVTSFTIDGFIPTQIQTTGSGTATIIGINNAKLTTTTISGTGTLLLGDGLNPSSNWSYNSTTSTLTLNGTEADLSGLRGLEQVDYADAGGKIIYTFTDTTKIVISSTGDLTIDSDIEQMVCGVTPASGTSTLVGKSGGRLQLGKAKNVGGFTIYSSGPSIVFANDSSDPLFTVADTWANFKLENGFRLDWYGGEMYSVGLILPQPGSEFRTYSNEAIFVSVPSSLQSSRPEAYIRMQTSDQVIDGFVNKFGILLMIGKPTSFRGYEPISSGSAIDMSNQSTSSSFYDFENLVAGKGNTRDVGGKHDTWVRLLNTNLGSNITVTSQNSSELTDQKYLVENRKGVQFNFVDVDSIAVQGAVIYMTDTNNGSRMIANQVGTNSSYTPDRIYTGTSNASGIIDFSSVADSILLSVHWHSNNDGNVIYDNFDSRGNNNDTSDLFTFNTISYLHGITTTTLELKGTGTLVEEVVLVPDLSITNTNVTDVRSYTELENSQKLYDRGIVYQLDNYTGESDVNLTRSGNQIDAGAYNVTIDATASSAFNITGNLITIKASTFTGDMVTTGLITLANGATFNGVRTDANGTVYPDQPISITNISAGSRMRIYNVTTGTETVNTVVAGTSYTSSYQEGTGYNDGDTVRVYLTKLGKKEWVGDVIDTSNGFSVLAAQVDDDVYVALGVDGSTITKFQADYPNNEVDLIIGSDWTMAELYAWWANNLTTEDGIRNFFGGITAIDQANFKINTSIVDLYLDNTTNASYKQTDNRRFFRDTGTGYPVRNPTTSGYGLDVVWRNTILIAQTEGGTSDLSFVDVKRAVRQALSPKDKAVIIKKAR